MRATFFSANNFILEKTGTSGPYISVVEARYLSEQIDNISSCEKISNQKLHNKLKNKFNYHSYLKLKKPQYELVIQELSKHRCFSAATSSDI